jgi:hypothetical protein
MAKCKDALAAARGYRARSTMRAWHPGHTLTLAVDKGVPQFAHRQGFDLARPIR